MKQLDLKNPPQEVVGRVREKIANYFFRYKESVKLMKEQEEKLKAELKANPVQDDQDAEETKKAS